jgi:hypothetical protein
LNGGRTADDIEAAAWRGVSAGIDFLHGQVYPRRIELDLTGNMGRRDYHPLGTKPVMDHLTTLCPHDDDRIGGRDRIIRQRIPAVDDGVRLVIGIFADLDRDPIGRASQGRPAALSSRSRARQTRAFRRAWMTLSGDVATGSPETRS